MNGVSTLDLVHIQRHILGIQSLNDPYNAIAADADNNGKISASDLTVIRKAILGISSSFQMDKHHGGSYLHHNILQIQMLHSHSLKHTRLTM